MRTAEFAAVVLAIVVASGAATDAAPPTEDSGWRVFFPTGERLTPVAGLGDGEEAFLVLDGDNRRLGWVFRTDRVSPVVKGYKNRAEIGVLVAVSPAREIVGIRILESRETPRTMRRIGESFLRQFRGRKVEEDFSRIDAVTRATISSTAIIKDVFLSARNLLERPAGGRADDPRAAFEEERETKEDAGG